MSTEAFPLDSSAGLVSGLCIAVSELPAPLEPTLPRENWRSLLALGAVVLSGPISGLEGILSVDLPFASPLAPPLPLLDPFFSPDPPSSSLSVASFEVGPMGEKARENKSR